MVAVVALLSGCTGEHPRRELDDVDAGNDEGSFDAYSRDSGADSNVQEGPDASGPLDAGGADGGLPSVDSGSSPDAGFAPDVGFTHDATWSWDASVEAGATADAGVPIVDAGLPVDAHVSDVDAGSGCTPLPLGAVVFEETNYISYLSQRWYPPAGYECPAAVFSETLRPYAPKTFCNRGATRTFLFELHTADLEHPGLTLPAGKVIAYGGDSIPYVNPRQCLAQEATYFGTAEIAVVVPAGGSVTIATSCVGSGCTAGGSYRLRAWAH